MLTLDVKHGQLWQRWAWQASWGYLHSNYYNDEVEHNVVQEFTELNVGKFEEHEESVELGLISHSAKQMGGNNTAYTIVSGTRDSTEAAETSYLANRTVIKCQRSSETKQLYF